MKALLATLLFTIFSLGCSSGGNYTSYIDGSKLGVEAQSHLAAAALSKSEFPDSKRPYYTLELRFKDGPRRYLRLNMIQDGRFKKIGSDKVQLIVTREDKMLPESDDALLQESITSARVSMKYAADIKAEPAYGELRSVYYKVTHRYTVTFEVYNSDGQALGAYKELINDSSVTLHESSMANIPKPSGGTSQIFDWIMSQAR